MQQGQFFFGEVQRAHGLGFVQYGLAFLQNGYQLDGLLVTRAGGFGDPMQGFFSRGQVSQAQLGLNDFNVRNRVHLAGYVDDVVVFKAAHHIDGRVSLADVRQKFVAQTFACRSPSDQAGNVHKLDHGWHHALRFHDEGQLRHARVGHLHNADVGLNRAKRIVFGGDTGLGQGVEQRGFTHIWQTDDATLQTHAIPQNNEKTTRKSGRQV